MPLNFVAKLAITAALTAGQMALQASQRIKGPRLQVSEIGTAVTHLRDVLGDQTYESLAGVGQAMTTSAIVSYAYDQIAQART